MPPLILSLRAESAGLLVCRRADAACAATPIAQHSRDLRVSLARRPSVASAPVLPRRSRVDPCADLLCRDPHTLTARHPQQQHLPTAAGDLASLAQPSHVERMNVLGAPFKQPQPLSRLALAAGSIKRRVVLISVGAVGTIQFIVPEDTTTFSVKYNV